MRSNLPTIIAQILSSVQLDTVERGLDSPEYKACLASLSEMKSLGSDDRPSPPGMQPNFKGRLLGYQMNSVCRRSGLNYRELFSAARVTLIARALLDSVHTAMGSQHTCSVLRRLRVLIALSRESVMQGYPLEMLLQVTRSFVPDNLCTDDAIGILRYMFQHGKTYLTQTPAMFAATGMLTLLSLKSYLELKPKSLTQESQYRATVSSVQAFHQWVAQYMIDNVAALPDKIQSRLRKMVEVCREASFPFTLDADQPATTLIIMLLEDDVSSSPVFDDVHRGEMLTALLSKANGPSSMTDEALADSMHALKHASRIWKLAVSSHQNVEVAAWLGRVLGRAYAASGRIDMITDGVSSHHTLTNISESSGVQASQSAIIKVLVRLLRSNDISAAACAEKSIGMTLARLSDQASPIAYEHYFPPEIIEALAPADGSKEASRKSPASLRARADVLTQWAEQIAEAADYDDWSKRFASFLVRYAEEDPIAGSVLDLTQSIEGLAVETFPFLLHMALQADQQGTQKLRTPLSGVFSDLYTSRTEQAIPKIRLVIQSLIYLLSQPVPQEHTRVDRQAWLDIDYVVAAEGASYCGLPAASLFLLELTGGQNRQGSTRPSRRSSAAIVKAAAPASEQLLLDIFQNVDDPDAFYGVDRAPDFSSVLDRADHEGDGPKSLMFHSARLDAFKRSSGPEADEGSFGVSKALAMLDLNSITLSLLDKKAMTNRDLSATALNAARKLAQWDVVAPTALDTDSGLLFDVQATLRNSFRPDILKSQLNNAFSSTIEHLKRADLNANLSSSALQTLASLTDMAEIVTCTSFDQVSTRSEAMQKSLDSWDVGQ